MKVIYEWGIPSAGLCIWMMLAFVLIPMVIRYLKKRADQTQRTLDQVISSVLGISSILFFLGLGVSLFMDTIPSIPVKLTKYSDALLIILFVLAGYLFLDRLMMEVLRWYSKKVDFYTLGAAWLAAIIFLICRKSPPKLGNTVSFPEKYRDLLIYLLCPFGYDLFQ